MKLRWLLFLALSFLTVLPFFIGTPTSDDLNFHVSSWFEVARQWRNGILYPTWSTTANFGLGEPRFLFYPPATFFIGATLSFLPTFLVVPVFCWIAVALAGLTSYRLARLWLTPADSWAAAVLYALNPYSFVLIHYRGALAELFAGGILPLLILAALRFVDDSRSNGAPLVLVSALLLLVNIPVWILTVYALATFFLVTAVLRRSRALFIGFALVEALAIAIAGFYLVPVWRYRPYAHLGALVADESFRTSFILTANRGTSISIVVYIIGLVLLGLGTILTIRLFRRRDFRFTPLIGAFALAVVLSTPVSTILWRHLPMLKYVQFCYRWLLLVALVDALLLSVCVQRVSRWVLGLAPVLILFLATIIQYRGSTQPTMAIVTDLRNGHGVSGTREYLPDGVDDDKVEPILAAAEDTSPTLALTSAGFRSSAPLTVKGAAAYTVQLPPIADSRPIALPLFCFEGWTTTETIGITLDRDPSSGLCRLRVSQPLSHGELRFGDTLHARRDGLVLSVATLLLLTSFHYSARGRKRPT